MCSGRLQSEILNSIRRKQKTKTPQYFSWRKKKKSFSHENLYCMVVCMMFLVVQINADQQVKVTYKFPFKQGRGSAPIPWILEEKQHH